MKWKLQRWRCGVLALGAVCTVSAVSTWPHDAGAEAPQGDAWSLQLSVAHVVDSEAARALAQPLARLPGVTAAHAGAFDHGTVKYSVSGRGR